MGRKSAPIASHTLLSPADNEERISAVPRLRQDGCSLRPSCLSDLRRHATHRSDAIHPSMKYRPGWGRRMNDGAQRRVSAKGTLRPLISIHIYLGEKPADARSFLLPLSLPSSSHLPSTGFLLRALQLIGVKRSHSWPSPSPPTTIAAGVAAERLC